MTAKVSSQRRREIDREAGEIRLDCIRRGLATEEIVDRIRRQVPEIFALEAWRLAHGWNRTEVLARLDRAYEDDGLIPPQLDASVLCRWEHGDRRPSDERIEYFCRIYRTRPDRLGFGNDHSLGEVSHIQRTGIVDAYPYTSEESQRDLVDRIRAARERVNLFGLTRNFYASPEMLALLEEKAPSIPIRIYVMDPACASRRDRYRIEPSEAAMEDPGRYVREVLGPLHAVGQRHPGLKVFLFNFPCSFAIEEVDSVCRMMPYGHGMRGTQGPVITVVRDTPTHSYLTAQLHWLERMSEGDTPEPWASKGIIVRPLDMPLEP